MDTPQTTPTRLVPFLIMVVVFWACVGVVAYAHSFFMSSLETEPTTRNLRQEAMLERASEGAKESAGESASENESANESESAND